MIESGHRVLLLALLALAAAASAAGDLCDAVGGCRCFGDCPDVGAGSGGAVGFQPRLSPRPSETAAGVCAQADADWRAGRTEAAARGYARAVELDPRHAAAYNGLGLVLERQGCLFEAKMRFVQAGDLGFIEGYRHYARLAEQASVRAAQPSPQAAAEAARRAREAEQSRALADAEGRIGRLLADLAGAMPGPAPGVGPGFAFAVPGSDPGTGVDLRFLDPDQPATVDPRVVRGEMTAAQAAVERAAEGRARAAQILAETLLRRGDYDRAIARLREARAAQPEDRNIQLALGSAMHIRDRLRGERVFNPKVEVMLDALEFGAGDWRASMHYLADRRRDAPEDMAVRDAFNFVEGMSGYFLSRYLPDPNTRVDKPFDAETRKLVLRAIDITGMDLYDDSLRLLQQARRRYPDDLGLRDLINFTEGRRAAHDTRDTR